MLSDKFNQF